MADTGVSVKKRVNSLLSADVHVYIPGICKCIVLARAQ